MRSPSSFNEGIRRKVRYTVKNSVSYTINDLIFIVKEGADKKTRTHAEKEIRRMVTELGIGVKDVRSDNDSVVNEMEPDMNSEKEDDDVENMWKGIVNES